MCFKDNRLLSAGSNKSLSNKFASPFPRLNSFTQPNGNVNGSSELSQKLANQRPKTVSLQFFYIYYFMRLDFSV